MAPYNDPSGSGTRNGRPAERGPGAGALLGGALFVGLIALCALVISYNGIFRFAEHGGHEGSALAHVYPIVFTLLLIMAFWVSYLLRGAEPRERFWVDAVLIPVLVLVAAVAMLMNNLGLIDGFPRRFAAVVVAVSPLVALAVAFLLWMALRAHLRTRTSAASRRRPPDGRAGTSPEPEEPRPRDPEPTLEERLTGVPSAPAAESPEEPPAPAPVARPLPETGGEDEMSVPTLRLPRRPRSGDNPIREAAERPPLVPMPQRARADGPPRDGEDAPEDVPEHLADEGFDHDSPAGDPVTDEAEAPAPRESALPPEAAATTGAAGSPAEPPEFPAAAARRTAPLPAAAEEEHAPVRLRPAPPAPHPESPAERDGSPEHVPGSPRAGAPPEEPAEPSAAPSAEPSAEEAGASALPGTGDRTSEDRGEQRSAGQQELGGLPLAAAPVGSGREHLHVRPGHGSPAETAGPAAGEPLADTPAHRGSEEVSRTEGSSPAGRPGPARLFTGSGSEPARWEPPADTGSRGWSSDDYVPPVWTPPEDDGDREPLPAPVLDHDTGPTVRAAFHIGTSPQEAPESPRGQAWPRGPQVPPGAASPRDDAEEQAPPAAPREPRPPMRKRPMVLKPKRPPMPDFTSGPPSGRVRSEPLPPDD